MISKRPTLTTLKFLVLLITNMVLFFHLAPKTHAAYFTLEPQTGTIDPGGLFSIDVKIHTDGENVSSSDALLNFNSAILSVSSITPGNFFPQNFKTTTATQVYVGGAVENSTETRTGSGLIATINFNAVGSGVATVSFDCVTGKTSDSNIYKSDAASDILNCDQLVDGVYTVSGNVTASQPTPTPKTLPESGNATNTLIIGGIGLLVVIVGFIVML